MGKYNCTGLQILYYVYAFTALIFEPLYYFRCNWELYGEDCSAKTDIVLQLWRFYAQYDSLFITVPDWLQLMCSIEVFIFGPCYLIVALFLPKFANECENHTHNMFLFGPFVLVFNGALVYSTVLYFLYEFLFLWNDTETNLWVVLVVNIPWIIGPVLLTFRVLALMRLRDENQQKKSKAS
eukprot:m.100683 g.100683  ORF g.100683 m.100683 type:complete len:181 (-) comp13719_c0_seq2:2927-3469(-)